VVFLFFGCKSFGHIRGLKGIADDVVKAIEAALAAK
jgi:hypothetical protein